MIQPYEQMGLENLAKARISQPKSRKALVDKLIKYNKYETDDNKR